MRVSSTSARASIRRLLMVLEPVEAKFRPRTASEQRTRARKIVPTSSLLISTSSNPLSQHAGQISVLNGTNPIVTLYKTLETEAINSLVTLNNLAVEYHRNRSHVMALELFKRCLDIAVKRYGKDHANTAESIDNIGLTLAAMGKYTEAVRQFERSLSIKENALGMDNLRTATTRRCIGEALYKLGFYEKAASQFERALLSWETTGDKNVPQAADVKESLARTYHNLGRYEEALPLYVSAREIK